MASSSKFDLSSGSPDRPLYTSGQRGSYSAASFDRSGSFRESMENPILSSLPSMSRSSSAVTQGDVVNFFQCFRVDQKLSDHKIHRQGEQRRILSAALGVSPDDSSSGPSKGKLVPSPLPDELKRVKAGLRESSTKARERAKTYGEGLSALNKCFPSLPSRKRSRSESLSTERSNSFISSDRTVLGPNMGKMGTPNNAMPSGFEHEPQKSEERAKNTVPNKRTRTSLVDVRMDVRANPIARASGGAIDRDREMLRLANSAAVQSEDRALSIGVDGWEKSKMKKKRSGIKPDPSPTTVTTKPNDGYREQKQGMQQRLATDARSRLNDPHGFRPGVASGSVGVGKAEGLSQHAGGLGMRSSMPRTDQDSSSVLNDRRERPAGSDKERVNLRAINKTSVREDFSSASPTSSAKLNAPARAPRSGTGVAPKLSPNVHRTTTPNDWELSHCTNKIPAAVGVNNRKRTPSTRSSSPPVAHWTGQRPQKNSRTARRTHIFPIVSSNDETPALDTISDAAGNENGLGIAKRLSSNSPQQVKMKVEHFSSAALSESEESGAAEIKSRDKGKKSDEIDEKTGQTVQKVSTLVPPSRKNKLVSGEDLGDGVRRQGRTGRGFTSTRSLMPLTVDKVGNVGTAKQLRSSRLGFDKTESKAGRPPTRKLSDRKADPRQRHTTITAAPDFLVGSDDGHEELLAAANAVINPSHAFSSSFWRQMEPYFGFVSDADIAFVKQQETLGSNALPPSPVRPYVDGCIAVPNGFGLAQNERDMGFISQRKRVENVSERRASSVDNPIPLCQRLIAALISEDEIEEFSSGIEDHLKFDVYGTGFQLETETKSNSLNQRPLGKCQIAGRTAFNGYRITATRGSLDELEHEEPENDMMALTNTGIISNFGHSLNGLLTDEAMMPSLACSEFEYENMSVDERLLLELHCLGIYPELPSDVAMIEDEEIPEEVARLEEKYIQVIKKKAMGELRECATKTRELQEKEFEQRALDKLVIMAYEKYMSCWGPNASGGKSASGKMAKQAALAFVKRTLDRCIKYEETGKSCFSEPSFREMFLLGSSNLNDAQSVDTPNEGESSKPYAARSLDVRVSASMGSQQSPSMTSRSGDIYSSDALQPLNHSSEQATIKEDAWANNRVKKREVLLDDVGGTANTPISGSGITNSLPSSTKGKRSERDREGKGHGREVSSRNPTPKIGRPSLSNNPKAERKSKMKPKQQKTTQLSASVNGFPRSDQPKSSGPKPSDTLTPTPTPTPTATPSKSKEKDDFGLDLLDEPIDLSHLPLPGMEDVLGDDLNDVQGQDLDSWFNEEGLENQDFSIGLDIPMDDLSDLNMMV